MEEVEVLQLEKEKLETESLALAERAENRRNFLFFGIDSSALFCVIMLYLHETKNNLSRNSQKIEYLRILR